MEIQKSGQNVSQFPKKLSLDLPMRHLGCQLLKTSLDCPSIREAVRSRVF